MSMQILTVRQFLEIFGILGIYFVMTLLLPAVFLYRSVRCMRFSGRFMVYQTAGSLYIIVLVTVLQAARISGPQTLRLFTVLPLLLYVLYVLCRKVFYKKPEKRQEPDGNHFAECRGRIWGNFPEIILLFIVAAAVLAAYDGNTAGHHGYHMSGITAYNSWIYETGTGQAVSGAEKPLWLYSIIYYLHTVFRLNEFMLFRTFWIVQMLLVYFMLLAFLRVCCRLKYSAYAGTGIYMLAVFAGKDVSFGAVSMQLQESGMLFVLLPAALLCLFFETKKRELDEEREEQEAADAVYGDGEDGDRQVFLLDEVLAETAQREAAYHAGGETDSAAGEKEEPEEVVLIMEENASGAISIKECPLDGTISIQDTSIDEIAEHATENIPLLDLEAGTEKKTGRGSGRGFWQAGRKDSAKYLVFFSLALGMALSGSAGQSAAAGIFCMAVCVGYCFRLFRIRYLWRVLLAGMLSLLIPAACAALTGSWNMSLRGLADSFTHMQDTGAGYDLTWKAVPSYLFRMGSNRQYLPVLLSVGLLVLLSVVYFIIRRTDYAARMLAAALYMTGMTLLLAASGPAIMKMGDGWACIRLYYAYALVIVWGLCVDGVLQGPVSFFSNI